METVFAWFQLTLVTYIIHTYMDMYMYMYIYRLRVSVCDSKLKILNLEQFLKELLLKQNI